MWFWLAILALLCWSGSDIFAKLGCQSEEDPYAHLKMVMAVGLVMGLHAVYEIAFMGVTVDMRVIVTYLPVSALYILSMAVGYLGLRYIELSISSPVSNSSGAIVVLLTLSVQGFGSVPPMGLAAAALVCAGVIGLGITEAREDEALRRTRQESANHRYAKSALAIALPIVYCILDALGTFADSIVLQSLDEDAANAAYELTFLAAGLVCAVYVLIVKKQRLVFRQELPKYAGALFETAGQYAYVHALADSEHVTYAVPIISAYCVMSAVWARIFLKERLSKKHYLCLLAVVAGIVLMAVLDI